MNTYEYILNSLQEERTDWIVDSHEARPTNRSLKKIQILHEGYSDDVKDGCIYLGNLVQTCAYMQKCTPDQDILFVIYQDKHETVYVCQKDDRYNSITMNCSLGETYNYVANIISCMNAEEEQENATNRFLDAALSGNLQNAGAATATAYAKEMQHPFDIVSIIIVRPDEEEQGTLPPLTKLETVFPESNIGFHDNQAIIFFSISTIHTHLPEDKLQELENLSEEYHCHSAVSISFLRPEDTGIIYEITDQFLSICLQVYADQRVFTADNGSIFYALYLCCKQFNTELGCDYFTYLAHPGVALLLGYDEEHGTDLEKTLITYLKCNCSYTKTAEEMYMHRNTVLYKIRKIKSMINEDLDSPEVIFKLLFSHAIFLYKKNCYDRTI